MHWPWERGLSRAPQYPLHIINSFHQISAILYPLIPNDSRELNSKAEFSSLSLNIPLQYSHQQIYQKGECWGFPGGSVVKNVTANSGDVGLIPGPGGSHMLWNNEACAPQLLSQCSRAQGLQLLKLACSRAHKP